MIKMIFLALIVMLTIITGCTQRDTFYYKGVRIENTRTNAFILGITEWELSSAQYDSLEILYQTWSKESVYAKKVSGKQWSIPVDPNTMKILDMAQFSKINSPCSATHIIMGKRLLLENKTKLQFILDTVRDCPAIKEAGIKTPE